MRTMAPAPRRLSDDEVAEALITLDGWRLHDGKLSKGFVFANFVEAIGFMMRVAIHAEALDHHPNWSNVYRTVQVELWTHDADGITALDVQLASKMNELAGQ